MKPSNIFKTISIITFLTLLVFCLAKYSKNIKEININSNVTSVKIWTSERHISDLMKELVDCYNNTTGKAEGIKIEYTDFGDDYPNTYEIAFASNQAPELLGLRGTIKTNRDKGWICAIEDLPGGKEFLTEFDEPLIDKVHILDGKTYRLPFSILTSKMVYNKDLFRKSGLVDENGEPTPPKTWADVVKYAKIITQNGEGKEYGIIIPLRNSGNYFWEYEILIPFQKSVGHYFNTKTGLYQYSNFSRAFTEYLLKIKKDKSYFPSPEGIDNDIARAQFSEGNIGIKMAASYDIAVYNDQFPAKCDWGIAEFPVLDLNGKRFMENTFNLCSLVYISKTALESDNPSKVMKVYKWLNGKEFKTRMHEEGKYIISNPNIISNTSKVPDKKGWKDFSNFDSNKIIDIRRPSPNVSQDWLYYNAFNKIWLTGDETNVQKLLNDLDNAYNEAVRKDVNEKKYDIEEYIYPEIDMEIK